MKQEVENVMKMAFVCFILLMWETSVTSFLWTDVKFLSSASFSRLSLSRFKSVAIALCRSFINFSTSVKLKNLLVIFPLAYQVFPLRFS